MNVAEARAILVADEALDLSSEAREASGHVMGLAEGDAWRALVEIAKGRVAAHDGGAGAEPPKQFEVQPYPGGNEPDFQTLFLEAVAGRRGGPTSGYTAERLTDDDAAQIAELLRVSLDDDHWRELRPKLCALRDKMIKRLGDISPAQGAP